MIPITRNKTLLHTDESTGVTYKLRYLTGDLADEFNSIQADAQRQRSAFIIPARKSVMESTKGQKLAKGELERLIAQEASRLAIENADRDPNADYRYARGLVDMFVAGWEGKDIEPLTTGEKASSRLLYADVIALSEVVANHLVELTGLGREEVKN